MNKSLYINIGASSTGVGYTCTKDDDSAPATRRGAILFHVALEDALAKSRLAPCQAKVLTISAAV